MADDALTSLRSLYEGGGPRAVRFRYALLAFDLVTIVYFIVTVPFAPTPAMIVANAAIGLIIFADLAARLVVARDRKLFLRRIYTLADIVVIGSLLVAPFFANEIAFLRVLRGLRLIHSWHLLRDLRRDSPFFRRNEDAVVALINLVAFLLVTASLVFVLFFGRETGAAGYIDALYFTVATLTTTGYGDITPDEPLEKLLSVVVMIAGVALFVRLAGAIFRPPKIRYRCRSCALSRHDEDAIHCKHCGEPLRIETEGAG